MEGRPDFFPKLLAHDLSKNIQEGQLPIAEPVDLSFPDDLWHRPLKEEYLN